MTARTTKSEKTASSLRITLSSDGFCVGSWLQIPSPDVAEIMARGSFQWLAVDMEHGAFDWSILPNVLRAIEVGGAAPLVRLPDQAPVSCARALDCGAVGVIAPNITTRDQIESVIASASWPPAGRRGVGFSRANGYGQEFDQYSKDAQNPFVVGIVENVKALEQLGQICSTPGLDAVFVGPYDLSASLGTPGDFANSAFRLALSEIRQVVTDSGIILGIHVVNPRPEEARKFRAEGYRFLAYSADSVLLAHSSRVDLS